MTGSEQEEFNAGDARIAMNFKEHNNACNYLSLDYLGDLTLAG